MVACMLSCTTATAGPRSKQHPLQLAYPPYVIVKRPLIFPVCSDHHAYAVCGTDGNTYQDDCARAAAAVHMACPMPCPCVTKNSTVSWLHACPGVLRYEPVCAARGVQFANPCRAKAAGADIQCPGPCPCSPPSQEMLMMLLVGVFLVVVLGLLSRERSSGPN